MEKKVVCHLIKKLYCVFDVLVHPKFNKRSIITMYDI